MTLAVNSAEWDNKVTRLLDGTPRQREDARWKMGYKTGMKKREAEILQILEYYQLIWWDESQTVWLDMKTGKPIHGLDWREQLNG